MDKKLQQNCNRCLQTRPRLPSTLFFALLLTASLGAATSEEADSPQVPGGLLVQEVEEEHTEEKAPLRIFEPRNRIDFGSAIFWIKCLLLTPLVALLAMLFAMILKSKTSYTPRERRNKSGSRKSKGMDTEGSETKSPSNYDEERTH